MYMKKLILIFAAAALVFSCNLYEEPTDSVTYEEGGQLIATPEELYGFEAGILSNYRAVHNGMYNIIEEVMLDGFNASAGFGNNYGSVHRTDDSYTSSDSYIDSYWTNHYVVIKNYNVLIDALDDKINIPEGYEDLARVIQGEAYFFRAEAYMNLVRRFAKDYDPGDATSLGVPVVIHYDLDAKPGRNTVHEVYAQIKSDLDAAAERLAEETGETGAEYPTMDAVNALYARYYLDTEDWEKADASADLVINTGRYNLSKTAAALQTESREDSGSEAILTLFGNSSSEVPNSTNVFTNMFSSQDYGLCYRSLFLPTRKLVNAYGAGDIRGQVWFSSTDYYTEVNGSYYRGNFATFVKYQGNPNLYSGNIPNGCQKVKPFLISEMYLIKAEALARNGKTLAAKTPLNTLQSARGATSTSGTLENIQAEWFRETVGEGLRLSCLKRWGQGFSDREGQAGALAVNAIMTGQYYDQRAVEPDSYLLVWPIPAGEIKLNTNLEQNDGYGLQ